MCLEKRTGWMDSSNAVVLNESLTLAAASPGGRNVDWESKAPLTMRSSEPKCVVEKKRASRVSRMSYVGVRIRPRMQSGAKCKIQPFFKTVTLIKLLLALSRCVT